MDRLRRTTWPEGGDSSADAVGRMPGGAAEGGPVCLVLGTASVTAIEKKKKKKKKDQNVGMRVGESVAEWREHRSQNCQVKSKAERGPQLDG